MGRKKFLTVLLAIPLALGLYMGKSKAEYLQVCKYVKSEDGSWLQVCKYIDIPDEPKTTKQSNTNLYKQSKASKQKQEFIPPELPYCRINYADGGGIGVTYWTKDGRKYELSWAVTNVTAGIGGATVSLRALYTHGNYGVYELSSTDYSKLINCVAEAAKNAIAGPHYNPGVDVDRLYLEKVSGDLKDYIDFDFVEY